MGNNRRAHISISLNTQAVFLNISMERIGLLEQVTHFTNPSKQSQHRSTQVTFISTMSDKAMVSGSLKLVFCNSKGSFSEFYRPTRDKKKLFEATIGKL